MLLVLINLAFILHPFQHLLQEKASVAVQQTLEAKERLRQAPDIGEGLLLILYVELKSENWIPANLGHLLAWPDIFVYLMLDKRKILC